MTANKPAAPKQEVAKPADDAEKPVEGKVLTLRERKDQEMQNPSSAIRNQDTPEDTVDHQLLTNAPAQTIAAMTGWSMSKIAARAEELEVTLKGSLAGDFQPK